MDRTPKKSGDHAFDRRMPVGLNHDAVRASGAAYHLPSLQPISSGEQAPAPSPNEVTKVTRQRRCSHVLPRATHYRLPVSGQSYSEAASKNFPPLQPETPAKNEREGLSTPAPVTCQDQAVQIATLRETPTASPASPDPAVPEGNEDPHSASRPTVIPTEPQVEPPLNKAPLDEHVAEDDETSDAHHMAAQSAGSSPVIEETPSRDDDVSVDEDSNSTTSETPLRIDEDTTPSDVSRDSLDVFVQSSRKSPGTKRHRISSSDSEAPSRDRSPLRASTRPPEAPRLRWVAWP
ncbi:hypothetical protein HPB52_004961 [Rhipicephalus sanguineus]|uniref:Uncharacterized protein n=1 Tax=Rhipicephalus sanguineus TaxID=34632 RepID=A0A9D4PL17_RHISA|nr:hypothetical protein HPB52_004961 [Rhipicephalus sanguineus]